jgi:hypothetical protein
VLKKTKMNKKLYPRGIGFFDNGDKHADDRQQKADSRQETAKSRQLATTDSRQQTADNRQQTADSTLAALVSLMMGTNMPMMTAKEINPLKFKAIAKPISSTLLGVQSP